MLSTIFNIACDNNATDIHLSDGKVPAIRVKGNIVKLSELLPIDDVSDICSSLNADIHSKHDLDFAFSYQYNGKKIRCRANLFSTMLGKSMSIRIFPRYIQTLKDLKCPISMEKLATDKGGLVLVTGATGSGKTTTAVAVVEYFNEKSAKRIITLEDPIEYIFEDGASAVSQREVGIHVDSYSKGLKSALREDPDIIFIGEIRDRDTMEIAINAAESGHLVIATLHSGNVIETIDRITSFFPPSDSGIVLGKLSNCLVSIIYQQLLPGRKLDRVAAYEILYNTPVISNIIRNSKQATLYNFMLPRDGMQTMDIAIRGLRNQNLI